MRGQYFLLKAPPFFSFSFLLHEREIPLLLLSFFFLSNSPSPLSLSLLVVQPWWQKKKFETFLLSFFPKCFSSSFFFLFPHKQASLAYFAVLLLCVLLLPCVCVVLYSYYCSHAAFEYNPLGIPFSVCGLGFVRLVSRRRWHFSRATN